MLHDLIEGRMTVKDPRLLALTAIGILLAPAALARIESAAATAALTPLASAPPAGLSVEAKDAAFNKGFDFKFKSGSSTATVSIDPLGMRHTDRSYLCGLGL